MSDRDEDIQQLQRDVMELREYCRDLYDYMTSDGEGCVPMLAVKP